MATEKAVAQIIHECRSVSTYQVILQTFSSIFTVELMGSETFLDYTRFHVGAVLPRDIMVPRVQNFIGYMSQLNFNNEDYFDKMRAGLLSEQFAMTASFSQVDDIIFNDISFKNQLTYLGLPQMKAYTDISISFRFKTMEMNGNQSS